MIGRLVTALVVLGLAGAAPLAEARQAPPKSAAAKKHAAAKQRAAAKRRALVRKRAAAKRRAEAKRKALQEAAAQVPALEPATPVPAPAVEAPATDPPATADPVVPLPVLGHSVGVTARDTPRFFLQLSRTEVAAGIVTVQVANGGEDGHDLRIESLTGTLVQAWDELASGAEPVTKDVVLLPGTYRVYCSLPGHALAGMDTRIEVRAE